MELKREAVSESIGYLIIFGLILSGIGLITLYGYPMLMQQQSSANMRNMEQSMIVLQNDIKSLTYKLANYKETSLRVSGGTLSVYPFTVTCQTFWIQTIPNSPVNALLPPFTPGELRYFSTNDDTVITIENGAVIEKPLTTNGSFMLADPRWYLDNSSNRRTLVVNLMNLSTISSSGPTLSETGVGNVRMRLARTNMTTSPTDFGPLGSGYTISITYSPNNNQTVTPDGYGFAWMNYMTNPNNFEGKMTCAGNPLRAQTLVCQIPDIQNIVVKEYDVVVESV